MTRRLVVPALAGALVLGALAGQPALAKHRKPVSKSYDVTLPVPYPAGGTGLPGNGCHEGTDGQSRHVEKIAVPEAGTLVAELTGYQLDWDLVLLDNAGRVVAESAGDHATTKEKITYKKAKAGSTLQLVACNWSGGPTGKVSYTLTFAK